MKKLICLSTLMVMFLLLTPAFAISTESDRDICESSDFQIIESTRNPQHFIAPFAYSDNIFDVTEEINGSIFREKADELSNTTIKKEFVAYLTNSWAKASQYLVTESKAASWTYGGGVDLTIHNKVRVSFNLQRQLTNQSSIGTYITVDYPNRYSKLGFRADFLQAELSLYKNC